jgi:hypothetical protein
VLAGLSSTDMLKAQLSRDANADSPVVRSNPRKQQRFHGNSSTEVSKGRLFPSHFTREDDSTRQETGVSSC